MHTRILSTMKSALRACSGSPIILATIALGLLAAASAEGASATWVANPPGKTWNTMADWNPATIPNGKTQVATFDVSTKTTVTVPIPITIGTVVFTPNASAYTIIVAATRSFIFSGIGVTNNSALTQNFVALGQINFTRSSSAGTMTSYTVAGGTTDGAPGGLLTFQDLGSASTATFVVNGGAVANAGGGEIDFTGNGNGSNATFTVNGATLAGGTAGAVKFSSGAIAGSGIFDLKGGATEGAAGATMTFADTGNANQSSLTAEGSSFNGASGALIDFMSGSAASSTIVATGGANGGSGGSVRFENDAKGGSARIEIFGNASLDISGTFDPGITIGSLEGEGDVNLGTRQLTIGANSVNTTFSGLIHGDGSIVKTGDTSLTLGSANTYTGGTQVSAGVLVAQNRNGSCTGTGPVLVNGGTLGGQGFIAGPVTIGSGVAAGGTLYTSKGTNSTATLTIGSSLVFNLDGNFIYKVNGGRNPTSDKVVANGVIIGDGATFSFLAAGSGTIAAGRVITAIDNTSADPIAGTFANLADGSTFTANGTTYQVSYEGGDGNDLTLTVIP